MMQDEIQEGGLLNDASPATGNGPGIDPIDAVAAVAVPRGDPAVLDGTDSPREPGLLVETRVSIEHEPAQGAEAGNGDEDPFADLDWPEGYAPDPGVVEKFAPLAKRLGLSRESTRELARFHAELDAEKNRGQAEFIARNNAQWLKEIHSHPEFGGRNLQRSGEEVASMLRRYGSPLLTAQIRQMNVQNWPEMFYFLARIARTVSEDSSPSGAGGAAAAKSTAQLLFPGLK